MTKCKVCASSYRKDVETLARNGVSIVKIADWFNKRSSMHIGIHAISSHLRKHTDISTKGLYGATKEPKKAVNAEDRLVEEPPKAEEDAKASKPKIDKQALRIRFNNEFEAFKISHRKELIALYRADKTQKHNNPEGCK